MARVQRNMERLGMKLAHQEIYVPLSAEAIFKYLLYIREK